MLKKLMNCFFSDNCLRPLVVSGKLALQKTLLQLGLGLMTSQIFQSCLFHFRRFDPLQRLRRPAAVGSEEAGAQRY